MGFYIVQMPSGGGIIPSLDGYSQIRSVLKLLSEYIPSYNVLLLDLW
jgi:hypothetical protein